GVASRSHRAELRHAERAAEAAHSLGPIQRRPLALETDRETDEEEDREEQHEEDDGDGNVECALGGGVGRSPKESVGPHWRPFGLTGKVHPGTYQRDREPLC